MRLQVRFSQWVIRVLVLAMILTAVPLPSFAGETNAPAQPRPSLMTLVKQAAAATPVAAARAQATGGKADKSALDNSSFFKSKAGAIALAVVAVGVGFAVYSAKHDRIHSVVRQGQ